MLKLWSGALTPGPVGLTDDFATATRENYISRRIGTWQMWTVIMAFTAMFLAAAIITLV